MLSKSNDDFLKLRKSLVPYLCKISYYFNMKNPVLFLMAVFIISTAFKPLSAQDQHYWNLMGGTRSSLMGGLVVGGVRDNSATFYNPGALGFFNIRGHTISATAYHLERVLLDNGAGVGLDIESNQLNIIPTMAAGAFDIPFINVGPIIYSLSTKAFSTIKASARTEFSRDIIPTIENALVVGNNQTLNIFEGEEIYSAQYFLDVFIEEYWGGLSYAKKINDNLSLGVTGFGVYTSRTQNQSVSNFAYDKNTLQSANTRILEYVDFWSVRFITKFGLALDYGKLKSGLTVTSPSINLLGTANINSEIGSSRLLVIEEQNSGRKIPIDIFASDRQERIKIKYKSPMSFAAGIEYEISDRLRFSAAAEWFMEQKRYTIINPEFNQYFVGIGEILNDEIYNSQVLLRVEDASRSVINFGGAIEYDLFEDIQSYFSFRTDYKHSKSFETNGISLGLSDWNIYHFTTGATYSDKTSKLGIGAKFSFGRNDNVGQIINISNPQLQNNSFLLFGENGDSSGNYFNFGVILSYTIFLTN